MHRTMGTIVRNLRKEQGMTQEALAELLNVSPQAVSKWENGACLPDTGLLPRLAGALGTSIDGLFAFGSEPEESEVDRILREVDTMNERQLACDALVAAMARYPRNCRLMAAMMDHLSANGDKDSALGLVGIGERLLAVCTDDSLRFAAIRGMALAYNRMGDRGKAVEYASRYPESMCGEDLLSLVVQGDEKARLKRLILSRGILRAFLAFWTLANDSRKTGDHASALDYTERFDRYIGVFYDIGDCGPWHANLLRMSLLKARLAMGMGDTCKALGFLEQAGEHCESFDMWRTGHKMGWSPCFDNLSKEGPPYDQGCWDILHESMLGPEFETIHNEPRYQALLNGIRVKTGTTP